MNNTWVKLALQHRSTIFGTVFLLGTVLTFSSLLSKPHNAEQAIQAQPIAVSQEQNVAPEIVDPATSMQATVNASQAQVNHLETVITQMVMEQMRVDLQNRAIEWRQYAIKLANERGIPSETTLEGLYTTQLQEIRNYIAVNGNTAAPYGLYRELLAIQLANQGSLPELGIAELSDTTTSVVNNSAIASNLAAFETQYAEYIANSQALQAMLTANVQTQINQQMTQNNVPQTNNTQQ